MANTRKRIVDYLNRYRAATPSELSRALNLTSSNIRHHLSTLIQEGHVRVIGVRSADKPGRPQKLFALTPIKDKENLAIFADALMNEIKERVSSQQYLDMLHRVAERLTKDYSTSFSSIHLSVRLNFIVQQLNKLNYQARWEAHKEAPHLILGHCPFSAILNTHPELCLFDTHLISTLLNSPVVHLQRLAEDTRGVPYCLFSIPYKKSSDQDTKGLPKNA